MWLAPAFLAGLLALGLPLWLHRFAKQTQEKQRFASLMLIEAGDTRRSRAHELRYWLLLALRLLLLALLVLAFAGPLWRLAADPADPRGTTLHVVVVDASLSMQAEGRWSRAREAAQGIIDALSGNDRAMLVAADHRLRILQDPVFPGQRAQLTAALAGLQPGTSRLDYGLVVGGASGWAPAPGERLRVHLVTDLQQSGGPVRFADLQPPPGVQVELVDVGADVPDNLFIASVGPAERTPDAVTVRIDGAVTSGELARDLLLEIDGIERGRRTLRGPAALPRTELFEVGVLGEGEHRVTARLAPGDGLPADDAFHGLLRQVAPRVLLVAATASGNDTVYLRSALQAVANPAFRIETSTPVAAATRNLGDFAVVLVSDAGVLTPAATAALEKYANAGGAVLMTLGARSQRLERVPLGGQPLATGRRRAQGAEAARVGAVDEAHPVLREGAGWRSVRFFRHVPVEPRDGDAVLLRFENGSPLLIERRVGQGRLLLLASPLDREWNDLGIQPLFVRFVSEAAGYLAGNPGATRAATVGSTASVNLGGRAGAQVFDPQGRRALMLDGTAGELRLAPDQPGFYELRGGGRSEWLAVNPDPRESRLARLPDEAIARWRALRPQQEVPVGAQPAAAPARETERLAPVWFWLLMAAAVLAFLEPLVANYHLFVRRERSA